MRTLRLLSAAALLALAAGAGPCGAADNGGSGNPDAGTTGESVTALFELPRGGLTSEFYALPFPNDIRGLDLSQHPRPNATLDKFLTIFQEKAGGFGTNSAIYVRFSGLIDTATLPADADASLESTASVYLVDVDPQSPEHGARTPLRYRFEPNAGEAIGPDWLASLPYPGFPLRPSTTYALVVTSRLRAPGDQAIARSADFETVMRGDAAQAEYAPLLTWLDAADSPDGRDDVIDATVFTTQDPVSLMGRARAVVRRPCAQGQTFPACVPDPEARDLAPAAGGSGFSVWEGHYDSPNFQSGDPPYATTGGEILLDASGDPIPQRLESLRFAVSVPKGVTMPNTGWPIVLYAHGTGGDYRTFIDNGVAGRMAAQGLAVISIDQVLHGPRNPAGTDPEAAFFNYLNPLAARDNVRQGGIDDFQLLRLAKNLSIVDGNIVHFFDPAKIYFMGHSQGGLTGPPFLAFEPEVKGAILSGAGGLIYIALLEKTKPVNIPSIVNLFIRDENLDEFNPFISLVQMFIEPSDPVNYGALISSAMNVYQSQGFVDTYAPDDGIAAFGVSMGLSPVAPVLHPVEGFALRGLPVLEAPVTGNLGAHTDVFLQYQANGSDGHFVVFDVDAARRQSAQFLGTLARTGAATLVP